MSETLSALTKAAKQERAALERRDALIVQARSEGAGVRQIARAALMTHPTVLNILRRESLRP